MGRLRKIPKRGSWAWWGWGAILKELEVPYAKLISAQRRQQWCWVCQKWLRRGKALENAAEFALFPLLGRLTHVWWVLWFETTEEGWRSHVIQILAGKVTKGISIFSKHLKGSPQLDLWILACDGSWDLIRGIQGSWASEQKYYKKSRLHLKNGPSKDLHGHIWTPEKRWANLHPNAWAKVIFFTFFTCMATLHLIQQSKLEKHQLITFRLVTASSQSESLAPGSKILTSDCKGGDEQHHSCHEGPFMVTTST